LKPKPITINTLKTKVNVTEQNKNELLSELRSYASETEFIEFKINNGYELGKYVSALSNAACINGQEYGYIIFGVEDKTRRIVGTKFAIDQKAKGNEDLIPYVSRQLNPRTHFEFIEIKAEERVVICRICAATNTPVKFQGTAYIRIGSSTRKLADHPEKERLIWKKEPFRSYEYDVAMNNISVDAVLRLIDYPAYFKLANIALPPNRDSIIEKLLQEKFIQKKQGNFDITNLGAILFASDLRVFESLSRKAIRVIIYQGTNKLKTKKEQEGSRGYAAGFKGLINYINDQLPKNEEIGKAFREEVPMFPELAIRELVVNAIIHQDFSEKGTGPMVEIFEDRIDITNPGKPLISTQRFVDHNPQSRNEKLAHAMRRFNICEERGSGIDKVIFECEHYQLPAPKFDSGENYTRVILYSHKTLRQMDKEDKMRACYLHACLKYVSNEPMTNASLRKRFGIKDENYSTASRIIAEAIKSGLIKDYDPENNSKKQSRYLPFWA
jgi:predicted HTH transcriptional regulator